MSDQVLSHAICRNLSDRSYEKRKQGALAIEQLVRQVQATATATATTTTTTTTTTTDDNNNNNNTSRGGGSQQKIHQTITFLVNTFIRSTQGNHRKGGLIGLAGVALGLGKNTALYLDTMLPAVCSLLQDQEARVRYYACESLYNIAKAANDSILKHFDRIFEGLCTLFEDPDPNVKEAAVLLDRLIKEIVTRSADLFELEIFIPRLRAHMSKQNPDVRQLLIQWIILLNTTPGVELLESLPHFLDGLFEMLEDDKEEFVKQTELVLSDFLREISASVHVDLHPMVGILVHQIKHDKKHNTKRRAIALLWLHEFLKLGKFKLSEYFPPILVALLKCIQDLDTTISSQANSVNRELYALVKTSSTTQQPLSDNKVYELLEILREALQSDYVQTKLAALDWICMILVNLNLDLKEIQEKVRLFPVLLSLLCDTDDHVVELTLTVLAQISVNEGYFHMVCVNLLVVLKERTNLLAVRGKFIIEKICELLGSTKVYVALVDKLVSDETINKDLEFCSLMVQSLNLILLTTDTKPMEELRLQIKNCQESAENWKLFSTLFQAWCYNPVSSLALCLLGNVYQLGARLVLYFANLDMTVGFLMQVDKLISLVESPTFVHMRLQLLEPHQHPYLLKILYGLLMLLPQNSAFNSLRVRLQCASSFGLLDCVPNVATNKKVAMYQTQSQTNLKLEKLKIDTESLFTQFVTIQDKFRYKRLAEVAESSLLANEKEYVWPEINPLDNGIDVENKLSEEVENRTDEQKSDDPITK